MKIDKLNSVSLLLLIALLNVFSSVAFSYPSENLALDSRNFDYLQADQNKKAVFFEEASVSIVIATNPDYFTSGGIGLYTFDSLESLRHSNFYDLWLYNPDLKHLLSQNIFPFQFFW